MMNVKNPYINASVLTPVGIIVILLGYVYETFRMANIVKDGLPTQSFFPFLIFLLGFPIAVYLLVTGILETKKKIAAQADEPEVDADDTYNEDAEQLSIRIAYKPFWITVLTLVFVFLFQYLGYTITAPLYLFFFQLIYDDKFGNYTKKIITAIVIAAMVYGLYVGVFNILFPEVWK